MRYRPDSRLQQSTIGKDELLRVLRQEVINLGLALRALQEDLLRAGGAQAMAAQIQQNGADTQSTAEAVSSLQADVADIFTTLGSL